MLEQRAVIGELHQALENGAISRTSVHAEFGEIIAGHKPGRPSDSEIIVFDGTRMALPDTIATSTAYERAREGKVGARIYFNG
jgi:ornithine cyclodeaminase